MHAVQWYTSRCGNLYEQDGAKIKFHYEKIDQGDGQISISVSSDVLDTAEDMAEAMADIPAKVCISANNYTFVTLDLDVV